MTQGRDGPPHSRCQHADWRRLWHFKCRFGVDGEARGHWAARPRSRCCEATVSRGMETTCCRFAAGKSAVSYAAPAPVVKCIAPAPAVSFVAPAPVVEHIAAPASVVGRFLVARRVHCRPRVMLGWERCCTVCLFATHGLLLTCIHSTSQFARGVSFLRSTKSGRICFPRVPQRRPCNGSSIIDLQNQGTRSARAHVSVVRDFS